MNEHTCSEGCACCGNNATVPAVGRVLIASLFLVTGWGFLVNFTQMSGYVGGFVGATGVMATIVMAIVLILKLGGALMLLTGFHARVGAYMLIAFTLMATWFGHNIFMPSADAGAAMNNFIMFWKNLAIIGGLLYVTACGAGSYSLSYLNKKVCFMQDKCPDCKAC